MDNVLFLTDSYKVTHYRQYPPNTTSIFSYFESRGGKYSDVVFFGLQYILKKWLVGPVVTKEKIAEAKEIYDAHLGPGIFNEKDWLYIVETHKGHLPLLIKAVPEGSIVPVKNVLFTVESTDPKCTWLVNYFETVLVQTWYPMTVATQSREMKKVIANYLHETSENMAGLPFQLHDFGYRGSTTVESAGIGGAAHLVNFRGTDTVAALLTAKMFYRADSMPGISIPATEHSTITSWGRDNELDAYRNMLEQFPDNLIACVSDSYDVYHAVEQFWSTDLKDMILNRPEGKGLVIRPDSGHPPEIVINVLNILDKNFGSTINGKGYKVLPSCVRLIQGDGINFETLGQVLESMKQNKWSAENIAFGSGGGLLQRIDRDTLKCAFKCSHAVVNGKQVNVFKDPVTDRGKKSKKGRLSLELDSSGNFLTKEEGYGDPEKNILVTIFENGKLLREYSFDEIRERAKIDLEK